MKKAEAKAEAEPEGERNQSAASSQQFNSACNKYPTTRKANGELPLLSFGSRGGE